MRLLLSVLIIIEFSISVTAQWENNWFPSELNIQPFTANLYEPRAGFMFALTEKKLRLDIGTSKDFFHYQSKNNSFSFGADLFTYTRLRSEGSFKFPVETIDYFFGLNCGYKIHSNKGEIALRFRISHISTHLVDGSFDNSGGIWKDGREPFVYSREFLEIAPYYRVSRFRVYSIITYNFHVIPEIIDNGMFQVGFDYYFVDKGRRMIHPFVAYDFKLTGIDGIYSGTSIAKAGIKFGYPLLDGLSVLISYISGKSIHGMLFDTSESYFNLGFNMDI